MKQELLYYIRILTVYPHLGDTEAYTHGGLLDLNRIFANQNADCLVKKSHFPDELQIH